VLIGLAVISVCSPYQWGDRRRNGASTVPHRQPVVTAPTVTTPRLADPGSWKPVTSNRAPSAVN
jgi:hypothetical protein